MHNIRQLLICAAGMLVALACSARVFAEPGRYIGVDEISRGMRGYVETVYEGTTIERFDIEVVSVMRNFSPGRDAILVRGLDERFARTGPVSGCSGSPVYIDGRMAGALAFGWSFSKEPIYGVTPIAEMLATGMERPASGGIPAGGGVKLEKSLIVDLDAALSEFKAGSVAMSRRTENALAIPLATSLPAHAVDRMGGVFRPMGFMPLSTMGASRPVGGEEIKLAPGSAVAVPLVTGDITMSAIGTVTEVNGEKLYAFGHSMLGFGDLELPMAAAYVHTVIPSLQMSFKVGDAYEICGTFMRDESAGVFGVIGRKPPMVDLNIEVDHYNDVLRVYRCKVAMNEILTPVLINAVIQGAVAMKSDLPREHTISYDATISFKGLRPLKVSNISTDSDLSDITREVVIPGAQLMTNPFNVVRMESVDVSIRIEPVSSAGAIWSFDVSRTRVKAGETITATAVVRGYRGDLRRFSWDVAVPGDLGSGRYSLMAMGPAAYQRFLSESAPHRFTANSLGSLTEVMRNITSVRQDRLYSVFSLPPSGLTIESRALPGLPAGKAAMLAAPGRVIQTAPYQNWQQHEVVTGLVVQDSRTVEIIVE